MSKRPSSANNNDATRLSRPSSTTFAPRPTHSSTNRVVPKRSKLALALLPKPSITRLATKPSNTKLSKENDVHESSANEMGAVSDIEKKQGKLKSRLGGSASKLGGLGSMVRHASRGFLKDVTNQEPVQDDPFVNVGVETTLEVNDTIQVGSPMKIQFSENALLTEAERDAVDGRDPDIAEIMMVKRPKARTPLDLEWAQSGQENTRRQEHEDVAATDGEGRRSKSGWWNKGKDKATDSRKDKHSAPSQTKDQQTTAPSSFVGVDQEEKQTIHKKGSLVLRAVRSVRSLAQVPSIVTLRNAEAKEKNTENEARNEVKPINPPPPPAASSSTRLRRKPGLPLRRPTTESGSSWEVGALSSPDRSNRSTLLTPPSMENRRHSEIVATLRPPPVSRSASDSQAIADQVEDSYPKAQPRSNVRFDANRANNQAENRLSVISILSTDGGAISDSATPNNLKELKEQRRSSSGSTIRWDPEVMSQEAKRARMEERRRLRREREAERAKNGAPTPVSEEKREKAMNARKRTPLSEVFDLDISSSSSTAITTQQQVMPAPPAIVVIQDPIIAATEALLRERRKLDSVESARPRHNGKQLMDRPRPVGIVAVDEDEDADATITILNTANADLQTLTETLDLSFTPDVTPPLPTSTPAPATAIKEEALPNEVPSKHRSGSRRASEPLQQSRKVGGMHDVDTIESLGPKPLRRKSGSGVVQQAAAWPPVQSSTVPPTTTSTTAEVSVRPRQRTRTSSSSNSSNPPSSFNPKLSLIEKEGEVGVASLTLKTLRAESGNVQKKARYYGELDKEAQMAMTLRDRRFSAVESIAAEPRVRSRPVSFPALDPIGDNQLVSSSEKAEVDVVTDIPKELADILLDQAKTTTESPEDVKAIINSPSEEASNSSESPQEFVYTGIDAQQAKSPSSIAYSSDFSFCNEFSSYDEVSRNEGVSAQRARLESPRSDVFVDKTRPAIPRTDQSIASVETEASYCVVSKRPPVQNIPPLVIHGKQPSIASSNLSAADDTFEYKMPSVFGRSAHRRAASILSVTSAESSIGFGALERPGIGDKIFGNAVTSPSEPSSPSSISLSPSSMHGYTSADSLFDKSQHRLSSTSTLASVFGPNSSEKTSRGNLFGPVRPLSLVSNYSDMSTSPDKEQRTPVRGSIDEASRPRPIEPLSPCEQAHRNRLNLKLAPRATKTSNDRDGSLPSPTSPGKQTSLRVRPRGSGHRRQQAIQSRPLAIAESICETQEEVPAIYHSPPRSRGSSNTTTDTTESTPEKAAAITVADPEPENSMVLRRYYTLQRDAQEAIVSSQSLWEDTAFSFDELSSFQPPSDPDNMSDFLNNSRRFYSELPSEMRARRRALAAPYTVPMNSSSERLPESPTLDFVFKDLSTWDHRRTRKVSEEKGRTRKVSEEKVRVRKISETNGRVRKISEEKGRTRKVSEKRPRKKSTPSNVPPLPIRGFTPFVDPSSVPMPVKKSSEDGLKTEAAPLSSSINSMGRSKAALKAAIKLEIAKHPAQQAFTKDTYSKENTLRTKHSVEGLLESPTGSLRISRPRPRKRGSAISPPSSIRL